MTTELEIRRAENGDFRVVRFEPVELARFVEAGNAQMFIEMLRDQVDEDEAEPSVAPAASPAAARPALVPVAEPEAPPAEAVAEDEEDPSEEDWDRALDRIAGGEKVIDVADDMGITFGRLRSKWAHAVKAGTHERAKTDAPVSGGVGGVLQRGRKDVWTGEEDDALLAAAQKDLPDLARRFGKPIATVEARKTALETKMQRMMAD